MASESLVVVDRVSHHFGSGALRKQILYDVSLRVDPGEIVILTGPSGSGKTTLLTLMGALRSAQEGSLKVLGHELRGASEADLVRVRRKIGYIFQLHNLLDALTASQNVLMAMQGERGLGRAELKGRAQEMLASVGLAEHAGRFPDQLSGGQKQRVAIARALAGRPRIILADEPTASLDKRSGRDVVDRIHELAKRDGCAVVLVTHDNRILDIADRIIHLEEGRLSGFADAVLASTQQLLGTLAKSKRADDLTRQVRGMSAEQFAHVLEQVTAEAQQLLQVMTMSTDEAFEIMLSQVLEAFTLKVGEVVAAERVSLFLADEERRELWSKVAQHDGGRPIEIRIPIGTGIAGEVIRTGKPLNIRDAYASPFFNPEVDRTTGFHTRSVLCLPILDRNRRAFAVITLLNKHGADAFTERDERALQVFAASIGVILETWNEASKTRRPGTPEAVGASPTAAS
ncbi:MAG TPA: ATP-binding cassette domain-containing protein [Candidatus Binatia bacterium]|nr:ATP-binding cassette domain-containing protein [Candidatus Binatia bacterium]